jgi:hypothetical protein
MAYINQEKKHAKAPAIEAILKKYGMHGSLSIRHHTTLVLTLLHGILDFDQSKGVNPSLLHGILDFDRSKGVNPYNVNDYYEGKKRDFLNEVLKVMNEGNYNNSDISTDYFDVGWHVEISIGKWNKPYIIDEA